MAEPVEVAINAALIARAQAFATAQAIAISLPNIAFTPPNQSATAKWLRATFMPAPSFETGIAWDAHNQHQGILQIDIFYGTGKDGTGEYAPGRIASQIIDYFKRGTVLTKDGVNVRIVKQPYRSSMLIADSWAQIPVSIPYLCFARP